MQKDRARQELQAFGSHYDYDVSYLEQILDAAPEAYEGFMALTGLARQRQAAPPEAFYAAKLLGALEEDCGPCVQLVADMAREAGIAPEQIAAVARRDPEAMTPDTLLGFWFAESLLGRSPEADSAREAVRTRWGTAGVIDLTIGTQIGRIFPMVKTGLGFGKTCQRIRLGDELVAPAKAAAGAMIETEAVA